jgi:hypothetical protein
MEQLGFLCTDFYGVSYMGIFRKSVEFHWNLTRIAGTVHEDQCTFVIISLSFLLRMRNSSDKSCWENKNTHYVQWLFFENLAVYEIMWKKNIVEPDWPQMTIWRMGISRWIPKSTNTHWKCVILIAFRLEQWLHERASMLRNSTLLVLFALSVVCQSNRRRRVRFN